PSYGNPGPPGFLYGTPVVWSIARKILNHTVGSSAKPLGTALGKLFGIESVGIAFAGTLRLGLPSLALLDFMKRPDVHFRAATLNEDIKQLEKMQEELDDQSCTLSEYLRVLRDGVDRS
ncbi:hypothetical protein LCGC14_2890500, partial [marine sediment metagenome]